MNGILCSARSTRIGQFSFSGGAFVVRNRHQHCFVFATLKVTTNWLLSTLTAKAERVKKSGRNSRGMLGEF